MHQGPQDRGKNRIISGFMNKNKIIEKYPLSKIVSMGIGGPASYFIRVKTDKQMIEAIDFAESRKISWRILGGGTNVVAHDKGYPGLIIKNEIKKFSVSGRKVVLGSGNILLDSILLLNKRGLEGMEKMAGIPGTIGGAVCGCSGAYGQEIKDCLTRVKIVHNGKIRWIPKNQCAYSYRSSIFKKKKEWAVLEAEFLFRKSDPKKLSKTSAEILKSRSGKFSPKIRCPGSFFKNILIKTIKPVSKRQELLEKIGSEKIKSGKLPSAALLEQVGAKGMKQGGFSVAPYHANLILNNGKGIFSDLKFLVDKLKKMVRDKFGISLTEEIEYLN